MIQMTFLAEAYESVHCYWHTTFIQNLYQHTGMTLIIDSHYEMYNHYIFTKWVRMEKCVTFEDLLVFIRFIVGFWFGVTVVCSQLIVGNAGLFRFCKATGSLGNGTGCTREPTATATTGNCVTHGVFEILRRQDVQKEINRMVRYH